MRTGDIAPRCLGRAAPRLLLLLLLLWPSLASAWLGEEREPTRYELTLRLGPALGTSAYDLGLALDGGITASSRLTWPMSGLFLGGSLAAVGATDEGTGWSLALSLGGTATDPWSTILDQDWVSDSQQSIEFSHTDSVVRGRMFLGDLSLRVGGAIRRGDGFAVAFVTGFRYERLAYEAYGVEGWQFDGRRRIPVSVPADSFHGGDYTSHRFLPRAGIQFRFERGPFQLECDLSPLLAIVKDTDDHVYRRKVAEATSVGLGVLLHLSPRLRLTPARARTAVSLVVDAEVRYLNTAGTLHQHYYGDDPSIPGDQTGIVIPDSTTYGDSSTSWLFTAGVVTGF